MEKILTPEPFRGILSDGSELIVPVRISPRCRRVSLRSGKNGFELVVPVGADPQFAYDFCSQNIAWIEKIRKKQSALQKSRPPKSPTLPTEIFFPFTGELFTVEYHPESVIWTGVRQEENRLIVSGKLDSLSNTFSALRKWLIRHAEETLLPYAGSIAENHGFSGITKYRTGLQKRSWGTCSRQGVVTLNASLLFFTKHLAEYVILHEFCHLKEMNHSEAFWMLLESVYPNAKEARQSLKFAQQYLPAWVVPE